MAHRQLDHVNSRLLVPSGWTLGLVLFVLTKFTDLLTTVIGLTVVNGLAERNPVGAWLYAEAGIAGLVGSSLVGVLMVGTVVEWARLRIIPLAECPLKAWQLYLISYFPLSCLYALATIHNSILVLQHLE